MLNFDQIQINQPPTAFSCLAWWLCYFAINHIIRFKMIKYWRQNISSKKNILERWGLREAFYQNSLMQLFDWDRPIVQWVRIAVRYMIIVFRRYLLPVIWAVQLLMETEIKIFEVKFLSEVTFHFISISNKESLYFLKRNKSNVMIS